MSPHSVHLVSRMRIFLKYCSNPIAAFALIAVIFGSLAIVLSPPFTGADEEAHFVRAYGISNGVLILPHSNGVEMPESFRKTIGCFQSKMPLAGTMYLYEYGRYADDKKAAFHCALNVPLDEDKTEKVATSASFYSPTSYIPQAVIIVLGRLVDVPIVWISYGVRFAVLIAYICMIAIAIRISPVRKWALVGVALLPLSITHVTNPGADYMLLGLAGILTALVVESVHISKRDLERRNSSLIAGIAVTSLLLMLPKGFFPGVCLLPIVLLYGGLKYRIREKVSILGAALGVGYLWQVIGAPSLTGQSMATKTSVFDLPFEFIKTMFYRWKDTDFLYTGDIVKNFYFADIDTKVGMPAVAVTLMSILFATYLFVSYPERARSRLTKIEARAINLVAAFVATAVILGSFAALYLASADMQDGTGIRGVQPRYFYVAFIMISMLPISRLFETRSRTVYISTVVLGSIALLLAEIAGTAIEFKWGVF